MNFLLINFYILCLALFLVNYTLPLCFTLPRTRCGLIGPISDGLNNDDGGAGGGAGEGGPFG